jgi:hypothetical protein
MAQPTTNNISVESSEFVEKFDGVICNCPEAQYREFANFLPALKTRCGFGVFSHGNQTFLLM